MEQLQAGPWAAAEKRPCADRGLGTWGGGLLGPPEPALFMGGLRPPGV